MPLGDPSNSEVLVFTFKEGLLSPAAHDLKLRVTRFSLEISETSVSARFEANSLKVVCAMKDGRESPTLLPGFAPTEIEKNIARKILSADRYPLVLFESTLVSEGLLKGRLTLCGVTRELHGSRHEEVARTIAEFRLTQSDFGIRPFSALLGTLRVRDEILVRVSVPATLSLEVPV